MSLDLALLEEAKDTYLKYGIDLVNGMEMPDINFPDGHLRYNNLFVK